MAVTKLEKLVNPLVMADMISYQLEKKLRATQFYKVDRTLTGRAGDTIVVPSWLYIGMAADVAENEQVPSREMDTKDISYTVKKAAIETSLTDEAMLSGFGDPVGNTTAQLRLSIQEKIDYDGIVLLQSITAENGLFYTDPAAISYATIVNALDLLQLEEQGTDLFLMINKGAVKTLRLDPKFSDRATAAGDVVWTTGAIGAIAGCQVVISNRLEDGEGYILTPNCLTAFLKRDINLETEREMSYKRTKFGADAHYTVAIEDYKKLVAIRFKK